MQFDLDEREATMLHQVLTNYLPELRSEISNTENYEWRQDMKRDEEVIKTLIARLESVTKSPLNPVS